MIHCLTSSYKKDFVRASALNKKLTKYPDVVHHIFVEHADLDLFSSLEYGEGLLSKTLIHVKPDGGEGGLGRSGTMARFPCYKIMQGFLKEGDTYVQLDSDVILVDDEIIIEALKCSENEIRGFYQPEYPTHLQRKEGTPPTDVRFHAMSGMTICAGWKVFNESIPQDEHHMRSIIEFMMAENFTPSEDVVLSYLLQRGHGDKFRLTNLREMFWRVFHPNGDVEILSWLPKERFEKMYNYNFTKDKMTRSEIKEFVTLALYDPNNIV